jgi:outer membrane protein
MRLKRPLHSIVLTFAGSTALAVALTPALAQESLSGVYLRAIDYDATLAAAAYQRDAATYATPLARSALLPQLGANGNYTYSDSETELAGQPTQTREGTNRNISVALEQSVFNLAAFRQFDQSKQQVALAEAQYALVSQTLIERAATGYFNVLAAQDFLRFARAENEAVGRQLDQAKERFEVGLAAITDVQEAQARFDLTQATIIDAERQVRVSELSLAEIAGNGISGLRPLQETIPLPAPSPSDPDLWTETALNNNLTLLSAHHAVDIANSDVGINRAARMPTVSARADYTNGRSETGVFPADSTSTSVGLQFSVPIFSGLAVSSRIDQSRSVLSQREAELLSQQRLVERDVRDAFQTVNSNAARVKALEQAVRSSRTALEASETGLEVGTRTAIDVLDAQQLLYSAERNAAQARYAYLLSVLRLKAAAGQLQLSDLREFDQYLQP